eukprot:GFUD01004719.1.p1 GENE.GFUD01004719.1~~GFUD01004719.1.p1  ORF type:complete len:327 (-),score=125.47 GFUD01004719.1:148-1128(-)
MHGDIVSSFAKHGFVFPVQIFSPDEITFYRSKYEEYVKRFGAGTGLARRVRGNRIFRVHVVAPWAAQIVRHPRLVEAVQAVLKCSSLLVWSSDLTVKPPNSSECFGWHQDCAYADLGPEHKLVTAWVALSGSSVDSGCVRLLAGSHKSGELRHRSELRSGERNLVLGQIVRDRDIPRVVGEIDTLAGEETREVISIEDSRLLPDSEVVREVLCQLSPGQASLHGWRTVHSSQPNTSTSPRLGLAIRYMAAEVRQQNQVIRDRVSLVCGEYQGDWFEVEREPVKEYGKEEWEEHKISMGREWERRKKSKELGLLPSHREDASEPSSK